MRLGGQDRSGLDSLRELVGEGEREWLWLWHLEDGRGAPGAEDWIAIVNDIALTVPGTLAYRAKSDPRMPARFRSVAPTFESLGWRTVDAAQAVAELTQILSFALLGERELRGHEEAAAAAEAFVALLGEGAQCITNVGDPEEGEDVERSTDAWATACPLTPAVAEAGVVGVGGGRVALLWALES